MAKTKCFVLVPGLVLILFLGSKALYLYFLNTSFFTPYFLRDPPPFLISPFPNKFLCFIPVENAQIILIGLVAKLKQFNIFFFGPHLGWLADKIESYVLPFRVGGGITLVGAFIPFALLCHNRESQHSDHSQPENERQKLLK